MPSRMPFFDDAVSPNVVPDIGYRAKGQRERESVLLSPSMMSPPDLCWAFPEINSQPFRVAARWSLFIGGGGVEGRVMT